MKVIIIDDDMASVEALTRRLEAYEETELRGTAGNGLKGISLVKEEQPDLLFLDVELPDMSGLEFLTQMEHLMQRPCRVVVYTAHSQYMLPAFRGKAFDFLLKPIDDAELQKIMQRCLIEHNTVQKVLPAEKKATEKLILYTNATDFRIVNTNDVGFFRYNHDLRVWEVVVASREEPIRLKRSVNNDTLVALDSRFVQVSQKFVVNINYLMEVADSTCLFYPPFDKTDDVKVGRQFRRKLLELFNTL